jgi:excisionase family DNA binding protein
MSAPKEPDILNIDQAAALLGVSIKTFNKVLHSQSLPARKIGREWKFSRQALIDWVGNGRSDEFYRENGGVAHSDKAKDPSDDRPRTSGWRLELD